MTEGSTSVSWPREIFLRKGDKGEKKEGKREGDKEPQKEPLRLSLFPFPSSPPVHISSHGSSQELCHFNINFNIIFHSQKSCKHRYY